MDKDNFLNNEKVLSSSLDTTAIDDKTLYNLENHSLPNNNTLDLPLDNIPRSQSLNPEPNGSQLLLNNPTAENSEECIFPWLSDSLQDLPGSTTKSPIGSIQSVNVLKKKLPKKPRKNFSFSHNGDASHYRPSYNSQSSTGSYSNWGLRRGSRKNSITSMSSQDVVGYLFGVAIPSSPARKSISSRVNIVTDSIGIYPSLLSLHSIDIISSSLVDAEPDELKDEEVDASSRKASFRTNLDEGDTLNSLAQSSPIPIPVKKRGFEPMPDVVELPENETLTVGNATRLKLATAALAFAKASGVPRKEPFKKPEEEELKPDPQKYIKNLLILCISFFFVFTAYLAMRNLQSSLNDSGGLGLYSLSCVYIFLFFGAMCTTTIVQRLRPKLSMLVSLIGFIIYNAVNFHPSFLTLIPASCIAGFCVAVIWTSHATYMTNNASSYAEATQQKFSDVLSRFHGIFFASFQMAQIVGGIISSVLFALPVKPLIVNEFNYTETFETSMFNLNDNTSNLITSPQYESLENILTNMDDTQNFFNKTESKNDFLYCAVNYCPGNILAKSSSSISFSIIYTMMGIFLACTLLGTFLLFLLLDPLEGPIQQTRRTILDQVFAAFKFYKSLRVLCLLPLISYSLLQTTFFFGEFAKAYVTCILGLHMLGYIMVCLSFVSGVVAFSTGILQKYTGPQPLILLALSLHLSILLMLLFWHPTQESLGVFFIVAILWGAGDGIITTQLISLIGVLFTKSKEAAFSGYKMAQALSAFSMFVTGPYVCTRTKIYTLIVVVILAICGFIILQVRLLNKRKKARKEELIQNVEIKT